MPTSLRIMAPLKPGTTLGEVGEFALLDDLLPSIPTRANVHLGPGDDAAVIGLVGDLVVSTDALVENVHFKQQWSGASDVGRKAVAVNVADIEAMGARPVAIVMTFSAPSQTPVAWVREFFAGVVAECEKSDVALIGGDITRARDITIAVTAMGQADGVDVVTRAGARPGDVVAVMGTLGWASAGLAVLGRGFRSPRAVVEAQRTPGVPYGYGRRAARAGASSMIDVSDGLLADLGHVATASGVIIDLDSKAFEIAEPLRAVASATGKDPLGFILSGGEDHALVATFAPKDVPSDWRVVGRVRARSHEDVDAVGNQLPGVLVDGTEWEGTQGWDHYQH